MKKISAILLFTCLSLTALYAQSDKVFTAYATSLEFERAGDYKSAISTMSSVYDSADYELNLKMGYLHYYAGTYTESSKYYKKAIAILPKSVEARMGYVYSSSMLEKWEEVKLQYKAILKIDPNNSFVNYNMGLIYYNSKEYAAAYKHFDRVCRLYPFDYANMLMFAWCNIQMHQNDEAKVWFKKVLLLSPYDKSALEGLKLTQK
ncbi:MAG: tetratricopeptide repeat protein [Bacteroidota bacterium]